MSAQAWHASDEALSRYAQGASGMADTASVEAHLLRCAGCRARLASATAPPPVLDAAWTRVLDAVQAPPEPVLLRVLRRLGPRDADAVLLSGSAALSGAWTLATLVVTVFAALAAVPAGERQGEALYLLVAPLVPVVGVVLAFASADSLRDLASATPAPKARLALLRTAAVVVTSVPLAVLVGAAVPDIAALAFAWLLPALALTLLTLVGSTWVRAEAAGLAAGAAWIAVVAVAYADRDVAGAVGLASQVAYLAVAALAAAVLALRIRGARTPGGYA